MPAIPWNEPGGWIWLGCFGVSLACLLVGALTWFRPGKKVSRISRLVRSGLLLVAVAIFAADSAMWAESWTGPATRFLILLALVLFGFRCHAWLGGATERTPRLASLVLLAGGVLLAGWLTWRLQREAARAPANEAALSAAIDQAYLAGTPTEGSRACTDLGRPIRLQTPRAKTGTLEEVSAKVLAAQGPLPFADSVIVTGPLDAGHNCHGWVFAGGRFFLDNDAIDRIVSENQYVQVERPAAGDLILYRDDLGVCIHSGIVKAVGVDGYVLIESKWGWFGQRVVHPPEFQLYSQRYAYYRSPRCGHLLRGLEHTNLTRRETIISRP